MRTFLTVLGIVLGIGALGGLLFVLSFRTRFEPVLTLVRRLNRRIINPQQLRTAGRPGATTSVIDHVGRTSGTRYRTPVVAVADDEGFVIALPYGPGADWVRNTMAAGAATIEHDGAIVRVDHTRLVEAGEANPLFAAAERRTHALFGLDAFLRLDRAEVVTPRGR